MKLEGPAVRLTIFIGEDDHWHHKPLYTEIVHRLAENRAYLYATFNAAASIIFALGAAYLGMTLAQAITT
jgi:Uncharacterized ACR, COG1993